MISTRLLAADRDGIAVAADLLRSGELVAFPTETVYGLGADALDPTAVAAIFAAKQRPADNPLIIHLADPGQLERVAHTTPLATRLVAAHWPGPLTVVLDARDEVPSITLGGHRTVAVRVPGHPVALDLLAAAGVPVAAPSANRSGRPSPTTAAHVAQDLDGRIAAILDGGTCPVGVESTVVDARGERPIVLRDGTVTREQLDAAAPEAGAEHAATPGSRHRHYAPRARVRLVAPGTGPEVARTASAEGLHVHLVASAAAEGVATTVVDGPDALAAGLYAALRGADDDGADLIVVEAVDPTGVGRAVMDRLARAAGQR